MERLQVVTHTCRANTSVSNVLALQMDLINMMSYGVKGYKYCLTFIDWFTKFVWLVALPNKEGDSPQRQSEGSSLFAGPVVVEAITKLVAGLVNVKKIHTDNGGEFKNVDMKGLCKRLNIKYINGSPKHPQSQGCVEKKNHNVKEKVLARLEDAKAKVHAQKGNWVKELPFVQSKPFLPRGPL